MRLLITRIDRFERIYQKPKNRKEKKMITNGFRKSGRNFALLAGVALVLFSFSLTASYAGSAREIDTSVNVALERFYKQVKGAEVFAKNAKGMLVLPGVVKAGFGIAGEYGEGAMRVDGKTVDYYNIVGGSYGLTIGAQKMDIIIAFMTDEALKQFRGSGGWEAGVDGNVALYNIGAGTRLDTTTMKDPIVGFVFDAKGFMADASLKGSKFTKLDKSKDQ
jgi:lipid-binding SYLF domain-containing protein